MWIFFARKSCHIDPVLHKCPEARNHIVEGRLFGDIGIGAQVIASLYILQFSGSRKDYDWNGPKARVRLQDLQHRAAVHPGHVEVKQDEIGERAGFEVRLAAAPVQIIQQLFAIPDTAKSAIGAGQLECIVYKQTVVLVIVDHDQNDTLLYVALVRNLLQSEGPRRSFGSLGIMGKLQDRWHGAPSVAL